MSLIAPVDKDGNVNISETSQETEKERKTGSSLDKDDFLQLLVAQMKYQDPLEPETNTEYVAQLAQFSELEQMQNLNQTTTNTSAYTLVGQEVYIETETKIGDPTTVQGTVEYVTLQNGKPYVSVNGELYSYDDIVQVIDTNYLISQYKPHVKDQKFTFLHHDAQDIVVAGVDLGSHGYQATGLAAIIMKEDGSTVNIPNSMLSYKDGKLTISRDAFRSLPAGEYSLAFVFDDPNETIDYDSVTVTVMGNPTVKPDDDNDTDKENGNTGEIDKENGKTDDPGKTESEDGQS